MKLLLSTCLIILFFQNGNAQGTGINDQNSEPTEEQEVFSVAEKMPTYPGGEEAMQQFIARNFVYPQSCIENSIQGTVYVDFVVELNGSTTGHKVVRAISSGQALSTEALRVCKLLEGFSPAMDEGKPVRVRMTVPVKCELTKERKKKK